MLPQYSHVKTRVMRHKKMSLLDESLDVGPRRSFISRRSEDDHFLTDAMDCLCSGRDFFAGIDELGPDVSISCVAYLDDPRTLEPCRLKIKKRHSREVKVSVR